ncbi:MAG TPA: hypothetical protein PKD00_02395 [Burkholderiales bacterium]|nr:hypothetical protein [Burkholderiales bacterium]
MKAKLSSRILFFIIIAIGGLCSANAINLTNRFKNNISNHITGNTRGNLITKNLGYESIEHLYLGYSVTLKYLDENGNTIAESQGGSPIKSAISTTGIIDLTFPEIVYLAGDYVADPKINISSNISDSSQYEKNFIINFKMFDQKYRASYKGATEAFVSDFIPKILEITSSELESNKENIENHKSIEIDPNNNLKLNCASGGGCDSINDLINKKGLYMEVNSKGGDHFGKNALNNYLTGHNLAIKTALQASSNYNLKNAYAYEAYAQHYLTDSFASGHIRTPIDDFINLNSETTINILNPILSYFGIGKDNLFLAFAKIMHDKDNVNGLWINSKYQPKPWKAYGDGQLFILDNTDNLNYIKQIMQFGIDQIFDAYKNRKNISSADQATFVNDKIEEIKQRFPDLEFVTTTTMNPSPEFSIINGELYEHNFRDWADGSTGAVCAIYHNVDAFPIDDSTKASIKSYLSHYCYTTISGFTYVWDYYNDTDEIIASSTDNRIAISRGPSAKDYFSIKVNETNNDVRNQQEFLTYPVFRNLKTGDYCIFRYPIKIMRYGTYTSLDEADGNSMWHKGVWLGNEFVSCSQNVSVYYKASSTNKDNYFGLVEHSDSSQNVELCTDNQGQKYLSNTSNQCRIWH